MLPCIVPSAPAAERRRRNSKTPADSDIVQRCSFT